MSCDFEYLEDKEFFNDLFVNHGGVQCNMHHFDFRSPKEKRNEFNKIRHVIFKELQERFGDNCQLNVHPDCERNGLVVDHFIPLSSNKLNKRLRHLKTQSGKKVKTQSFGSNEYRNFVLACRRCNAFKQNDFPKIELISKILSET